VGSLGAAIGLMMWMWMSVIIILLGPELNSEIEHLSAPDREPDQNVDTREPGRANHAPR
jgi:uncharacterized BrkB/YihY/UPF0761 family membrane protein